MKRWFFTRKFNRFDIAVIIFAALIGSSYGLCAVILSAFVGVMLSCIGERSLNADAVRGDGGGA